jgi:hypothetical protein
MTDQPEPTPPPGFDLEAEKSREDDAAADGLVAREAPPEFNDTPEDDLDLSEGDVEDDV